MDWTARLRLAKSRVFRVGPCSRGYHTHREEGIDLSHSQAARRITLLKRAFALKSAGVFLLGMSPTPVSEASRLAVGSVSIKKIWS